MGLNHDHPFAIVLQKRRRCEAANARADNHDIRVLRRGRACMQSGAVADRAPIKAWSNSGGLGTTVA